MRKATCDANANNKDLSQLNVVGSWILNDTEKNN